ncbi:hypothetical protein PPTG_23108 [Phytophthora nicotianae INRA-310]|uniref:Uncharacterized protein n=1 Tax=Phytophthora nicotianae (strain INRA-310) TaxID=761204 RepID=W2Q6S5_PHYN3|nr:hypothetical protein PPTG_23108 [Phytophthora nicotianae INRA-310]ETN07960.1 hypothetical protein PPTG_23108 [Phytophthora nicotianae INRA-310]
MLDANEKVISRADQEAFNVAALNQRPSPKDQTAVLKYLFATEFVSRSFIKSIIVKATRRSSLDAAKFLYAKGVISPGMIETAFLSAVDENESDVLSFLARLEPFQQRF